MMEKMQTEKILKIRDLEVGFQVDQKEVQILHHVSLDIGYNEVLAVIGETGCGKSVTGSTILRILPENAIVRGEILYERKNILSMSEEEFRKMRGKEIASVPQSPSTSLDPLMRVGEQVAECVTTGNKQSRRAKENVAGRVKEIFHKMKLPREEEMYGNYPCELSGGMKQRVLLSMGIITSPRLLVVDEPTKAIDWALRKEVVAQLKELKDEMKCSMLFITHDLGAAKIIADRIAVMYCGEVVEMGTTEEVLYHPNHPYTKGLLASMPSNGMHVMKGYMPSFSENLPPCRFMPRCPEAFEKCGRQAPHLGLEGHVARCHHCKRKEVRGDASGNQESQ